MRNQDVNTMNETGYPKLDIETEILAVVQLHYDPVHCHPINVF